MNENLIDLVLAGQVFKRKIGIKRFGWPIVKICEEFAFTTLDTKESKILEKCIISLINNTPFWVAIWSIPINKVKVDSYGTEKELVVLLAKSIIATAQQRKEYLFSSSSFSTWNQNQFSQGIEWAWYSIYTGAPIDSHEKVPRLKIENA